MRLQDYEPPKGTLAIVGVVMVVIPVLLVYFLVSGADSYVLPGGAASTTSAASSSGVQVSLYKGANDQSNPPGFSPDSITLVIGVNSTVTWTNNDSAVHTVTSNNQTAGAAVFDSSFLNAGQTFQFTFTTPGTYLYHCNLHAWMTGTVKVVGKA